MKNLPGEGLKSKLLILIGVVLAIGLVAGISIWQSHQTPAVESADYSLESIKGRFAKIDYKAYDLNSIIGAEANNGNLPENIYGDPKAPVVIYEYADYACQYCAALAPYLEKIVQDYDGKVAIVFRSYILSYHPNGVQVAAAAEAAAIQGYWAKYRNLLFSNQSDWFNLNDKRLQKLLETYFEEASEGKGNLEQFRKDMASDAVAQKIAFDMGAGQAINLGGTPWLYLDGEWIEVGKLAVPQYAQKVRSLIKEKLESK